MTLCKDCRHLHQDSAKGRPWYWLCMKFPQDRTDPVGGEQLPPYHRCHDVLKITENEGDCSQFEEANPRQMELTDDKET